MIPSLKADSDAVRQLQTLSGGFSGCRRTASRTILGSMTTRWTKERLHDLVTARMRGVRLIAVSNREPYIHVREEDGIRCQVPASGLTTAIDPILRASHGCWVAHGSGNADRIVVDGRNRIAVPPENPSYHLRRVWLSKEMEDEYYYGLSNEGLWPLCHIAFHLPKFSSKHWASYRRVNELFAKAVLEEAAGNAAVVFVQDYHLALLPRMLKRANPNLMVAQFWHIPWPNRETFRAFPWKEELLDGMLGNDLLGFHTRHHCHNFLDTIDRNIEALVETERSTIRRSGHDTLVRPYPISIDSDAYNTRAASLSEAETGRWYDEIGYRPEILGIGIDRIDYTKGIPQRIEAVDRLLSEHPEYIGRFTFLQVGVPSRVAISAYDDLNRQTSDLVNRVNARWSRGSWKPIVFVHRHVDQGALIALNLIADFCAVTSLHDGMNLVAKEFVASRIDEDGVLVLSAFTGAARELSDALIVNPFSVEEIAAAMHAAIGMPAEERRRRMSRMRRVVSEHNVYRWAGKILSELASMYERQAGAGRATLRIAALAGSGEAA